jgi:hypothetical protein
MNRFVAAGCAVGLVVVTGCSSGRPGALTAAAQRQLVPKVQEVRDTAATGTYADLGRDVQQLKTLVERLHSQGQVTDARFSAIEDAADALLNDAKPAPAASPTPSQTSSSPTPTTTPSSSPTPTTTPSSSPTPTDSQSPTPATSISISVP